VGFETHGQGKENQAVQSKTRNREEREVSVTAKVTLETQQGRCPFLALNPYAIYQHYEHDFARKPLTAAPLS